MHAANPQSRIDKAFRIGFQQKPFVTQARADNIDFIVILQVYNSVEKSEV
jgi:hypothetical protein